MNNETNMVDSGIGLTQNMISSEFDIDDALKNLSSSLFEIDQDSRNILQLLAETPKMTEYELGKMGKKYKMNRDLVRRRINGTESMISLFMEHFVYPAEEHKFKEDSIIRHYDLTLKGIIAVLTNIKFEESYHVKTFHNHLVKLIGTQMADLVIIHTKYHIASILSWYQVNQFRLTRFTAIDSLFHHEMTRKILFDYMQNPSLRKDDLNMYTESVKGFFIVRHLLNNLTIKPIQHNIPNIMEQLKNEWVFWLQVTARGGPFIQRGMTGSKMTDNRIYDQKDKLWTSKQNEIASIAKQISIKLNVKSINEFELENII